VSTNLSIIIPVYNSEHTITRCVQSILNQQFTDFELILVDDGSTDNSGKLCDQFAAEDERVTVIHKENTGVSDSRNLAIRQAKGAFLQFVDSDDWITPDASKLLYQAATTYDCDMVIADFYRVVGRRVSHKGNITSITPLTRIEFAEKMMEKPADFYYGVLWNKLFRRDIIEKHALCMDTQINWCEDFLFNLEYIRHAKSFYALHVPIYYYVRRKGSLASQGMSLSKTISMKKMVFSHYHQFYKDIFSEEDYEKNRIQIYKFLLDVANDGSAAHSILRSSQSKEKLNPLLMDADINGALTVEYAQRKLSDYYLAQVAAKCGLKLNDIRTLALLCQVKQVATKRELADFLNISTNSLNRSIQKLVSKNYIQLEGTTVLPAAAPILQELKEARLEYERIKFKNFTDEELSQYEYLSNKIKENARELLA